MNKEEVKSNVDFFVNDRTMAVIVVTGMNGGGIKATMLLPDKKMEIISDDTITDLREFLSKTKWDWKTDATKLPPGLKPHEQGKWIKDKYEVKP